jgi:PhzF family phenazine biosynthesis protein
MEKSMKIVLFQVDAFTDELFHGNPAAICMLDEWLDEDLMQKIAMENNLSETAFVVKKNDQFQIRWFTPIAEVDLCGHATLATAHVIFNEYTHNKNVIIFNSIHSGILKVKKDGEYLTLDFPAQKIIKAIPPDDLIEAIGKEPIEIYKGKTDYLLVYQNEKEIQTISPDFTALSKIKVRGVIVTAKGAHYDFVSRFFAPKIGVNEDPVTGSAHTILIPYWRKKLNKNELVAKQLSIRQGIMKCRQNKNRVYISGKAITYLKGEIINL